LYTCDCPDKVFPPCKHIHAVHLHAHNEDVSKKKSIQAIIALKTKAITGKGAFLYYVTGFLSLFDPPSPP